MLQTKLFAMHVSPRNSWQSASNLTRFAIAHHRHILAKHEIPHIHGIGIIDSGSIVKYAFEHETKFQVSEASNVVAGPQCECKFFPDQCARTIPPAMREYSNRRQRNRIDILAVHHDSTARCTSQLFGRRARAFLSLNEEGKPPCIPCTKSAQPSP